MPALDLIRSHLTARLPRYLADLERLVNRDCGTAYKPGVDRVGEWVRRRLQQMGAEIEVRQQQQYGDLLFGRWRGEGRGRVLLSAHFDTVYPVGTAEERPLVESGEILRGPGVADMKAGLLSGLYAVEALLSHGFDDFAEIGYIFSSEEEVGSPVSRSWLAELAPQYDAGLVLEAGRANGNLVTHRKGGGTFELRVSGRAAHAGVEPEKGASAFLELAHHALALDALNGTIPGTTLVIGLAGAGKASNMVPDEAWATVDCRATDVPGLQALLAKVRTSTHRQYIDGTAVTLRGEPDRPPWAPSPESERLFILARALAVELGFDVAAQSSGGTSDANFLVAAGLPCLDALGPVGGDAHSAREWLLTESIVPRTALVAGLIAAVGRGEAGLRGQTS